jgi:hypothetical protein
MTKREINKEIKQSEDELAEFEICCIRQFRNNEPFAYYLGDRYNRNEYNEKRRKMDSDIHDLKKQLVTCQV